MGANRLEKYETVILNRKDIRKAPYNPRTITDEAAKKLRKFMREKGMLSPPIVNKRTMNLVSGHQRITQMDTLLRKDDYDITVALVDMDETEEVKANLFLNNKAAQGEYDYDMLADIAQHNPDIDFINDIGFDAIDMDIISQSFPDADLSDMIAPEEPDFTDIEAIKDRKNAIRKGNADSNRETGNGENNDYTITFVFPSNTLKKAVCRDIGMPETEKFVKSQVLYDIANGVYKLGLDKAGLS